MVKRIVLVTGGFDPVHSGHIEYIKAAKKLGDYLVVGLNSDEWLTRKKGKPFMAWSDRNAILSELRDVDEVISFDDYDNTACDAIIKLLLRFEREVEVIFANGGDRDNTNIPELESFKSNCRVKFIFGVGGSEKKNSSSWILESWRSKKTERPWGYWKVLEDKKVIKVKELVIRPGCCLSNQKHFKRSEHWYILQGSLRIDIETDKKESLYLTKNNTVVIDRLTWHKAYNVGQEDCHVVEIQYGEECIEEDIERKD